MNEILLKIGSYVITLVVGLCIGYFLFQSGEAVEGQDALQGVQTKIIPCKEIEVYKPRAKALVNLPKEMIKDKNLHVVSAINVPADDHEHKVSAVLLEGDDGVSRIKQFDYQKPWPLLSFKRKTTISAGAGVSNLDSKPGWRVKLGRQFMTVKGVKATIEGVTGSDGYSGGMVYFNYSW